MKEKIKPYRKFIVSLLAGVLINPLVFYLYYLFFIEDFLDIYLDESFLIILVILYLGLLVFYIIYRKEYAPISYGFILSLLLSLMIVVTATTYIVHRVKANPPPPWNDFPEQY